MQLCPAVQLCGTVISRRGNSYHHSAASYGSDAPYIALKSEFDLRYLGQSHHRPSRPLTNHSTAASSNHFCLMISSTINACRGNH
ncbi:hypothetical protein Y032_0109g104 [Ancylostoma ceylanicum]|uniref:Uncharacterized protein n=1 Tax=Ancylostoma ceylanicum TaxID=53326 RepID=A0A016TEN8_9BILA|nr:hypothetical protein Y032_0109g104 [Ancylostoma ceylanicum]